MRYTSLTDCSCALRWLNVMVDMSGKLRRRQIRTRFVCAHKVGDAMMSGESWWLHTIHQLLFLLDMKRIICILLAMVVVAQTTSCFHNNTLTSQKDLRQCPKNRWWAANACTTQTKRRQRGHRTATNQAAGCRQQLVGVQRDWARFVKIFGKTRTPCKPAAFGKNPHFGHIELNPDTLNTHIV